MSSLLNSLKIEADIPEGFGNNGTQYRRNNKTVSGAEGVTVIMKETSAFIPAFLKSKEAGKAVPEVSQSALCSTALIHGLINDLANLKKVCPRFDKAHLRYIRDSFGLNIAYVAKATKELIEALKECGHYGANNGSKIGQPVFFLNDVEAIVKPVKAVTATKKPATAKK